MGLFFRKSINFGLFRLNFSKSGVGFSFGIPGFRRTFTSKGKKYTTLNIPGTGIFYRESDKKQ